MRREPKLSRCRGDGAEPRGPCLREVYAVEDAHPVTKGHVHEVPRRHCPDYFAMTEFERQHTVRGPRRPARRICRGGTCVGLGDVLTARLPRVASRRPRRREWRTTDGRRRDRGRPFGPRMENGPPVAGRETRGRRRPPVSISNLTKGCSGPEPKRFWTANC